MFCTVASRKNVSASNGALYAHALYAMGWSAALTLHRLPPICVRHAQEQWDAVDLLCAAHGYGDEETAILRLMMGFVERPEGDPQDIYERADDLLAHILETPPARGAEPGKS